MGEAFIMIIKIVYFSIFIRDACIVITKNGNRLSARLNLSFFTPYTILHRLFNNVEI